MWREEGSAHKRRSFIPTPGGRVRWGGGMGGYCQGYKVWRATVVVHVCSLLPVGVFPPIKCVLGCDGVYMCVM